MFSFFKKNNNERLSFVKSIANNFASDYKVSSSHNNTKYEIRISTRMYPSLESYSAKGKNFLKENGYELRPHPAGVQGDKGDIYLNFTYPPSNADNRDYCYIDVIWTSEHKKYMQ
jgi:hypothetical protein